MAYKVGAIDVPKDGRRMHSVPIPRLGGLAIAISFLLTVVLFAEIDEQMRGATLGKKVDSAISFAIDTVMGIPHILLLLLISYAMGKGLKGVIAGVALTHWTSLARLIRGEVMQLRESEYIQIAGKLGLGKWEIAKKHIVPHVLPQFIVGLVLLFPHAILHESSITFLGFGLSTEQPAIGVILSESMRYLIMGKWWLAVFPGMMLVLTVVLFEKGGTALRQLLDPGSVHK